LKVKRGWDKSPLKNEGEKRIKEPPSGKNYKKRKRRK